MTLTQTRPDHGTPHIGKYAALVRVSTDKQDVVNQEFAIKQYLNGGDFKVKWFKEEGISSGTSWHDRKVLHDCLDYCRKEKATLIVYSMSRLSRRVWETLRFFEQEITNGRIQLVVVDNPILDHNSIGIIAAVNEMERNSIKQRTKESLKRIKNEIEEKGSYLTKNGKVITKLGTDSKTLDEASKLGNASNAANARARARRVLPMIMSLQERGLGYRGIARELNRLGIDTPKKMQRPDTSKRTEWYASSVRNYIMRVLIGRTK